MLLAQNISDIFDRAVHPLYSVSAFISAIIIAILLINSRTNNLKTKLKSYEKLFIWFIIFCIQDGIWGLFASFTFKSDILLTICSYCFHFSAAFSTVAWVKYMISFLGDNIGHKKMYKIIAYSLFTIQIGLLVANGFVKVDGNPLLFYVDSDGFYRTTDYRTILFYLQFFVYIIVFIGSIFAMIVSNKKKVIGIWKSVYIVNLAPFLFSIFQMIYADAPADSLGFCIGCVIIHTYLVRDYEKEISYFKEKESLQQDLEVALERAQQSDNAKTTFLFNMSHDIRTPINAIIGFTKIAENHIDDKEKVIESISKIELSSNQLLNLINDILEMSRIETGRLEIAPKPISINALTNSINAVLQPLALEKSIDYNVQLENITNECVNIDASHVSRIIINLVSNSIKYTKNGGKVWLKISQLDNVNENAINYKITVCDTGIGMSEEFMRHMYEEFSRERTSTVTKQQGSGLGLAITKRIVDALNGSINVESKEGVGTTFTVVLPMEVIDEIEEDEKVEEKKPASTINLEGLKVLVVDDNELNREIAKEILEDEGMKVELAEDGDIAVKKIAKNGATYYDIVFMDIQMPIMNGYEASKKIRELPDGEKILIIALSANAFQEDKARSIEAGMNDHIAKPIDLDELFSTLSKYYNR